MEINILKKGFTLLELLIVIAIIGILVSISVASFSLAQKQSRDQRRKTDVKAIQDAWEQYYADNSSSYPSSCTISTAYLPAGVPTDPRTDDSYAVSCSASTYCFCGEVEAGTGNADGSCSYVAASKTHYCVSNLQ